MHRVSEANAAKFEEGTAEGGCAPYLDPPLEYFGVSMFQGRSTVQ